MHCGDVEERKTCRRLLRVDFGEEVVRDTGVTGRGLDHRELRHVQRNATGNRHLPLHFRPRPIVLAPVEVYLAKLRVRVGERRVELDAALARCERIVELPSEHVVHAEMQPDARVERLELERLPALGERLGELAGREIGVRQHVVALHVARIGGDRLEVFALRVRPAPVVPVQPPENVMGGA